MNVSGADKTTEYGRRGHHYHTKSPQSSINFGASIRTLGTPLIYTYVYIVYSLYSITNANRDVISLSLAANFPYISSFTGCASEINNFTVVRMCVCPGRCPLVANTKPPGVTLTQPDTDTHANSCDICLSLRATSNYICSIHQLAVCNIVGAARKHIYRDPNSISIQPTYI